MFAGAELRPVLISLMDERFGGRDRGKGFSLQDALEIAYSDNIDEIFIEPPDSDVLTDVDSGDKDGSGFIDNLSGRQLRGQAEVKLLDNTRVGGCSSDDLSRSLGSLHASPKHRSPSPSQNKAPSITQITVDVEDFDWVQRDLQPNHQIFPTCDFKPYQHLSPVELLELFIHDDIIHMMIEETSRYALFKNRPDPKVSVGEMKCYIGFLIISGYIDLPGKRFYWDSNNDMRNELVYMSMRRDRFLQISRFIHFAANCKPELSDKVWKMRPLMDKIKENFLAYFEPEEHLCYDESMIRYFGKHSCKQFFRVLASQQRQHRQAAASAWSAAVMLSLPPTAETIVLTAL
ncbi:piggyBac transposable element-derived protein 3-like [Anthonomus grandis grandis]|uniref:piggyBac transposable element-derived protein 3-like n=1 Tax=Anthonomus grandis grandis TaxID=2921223 RepID=UPI0021652A1B|nr:piggyBac transposable element-derived protein 3-like [Anthonomus grandis grandis]